MLGLLLPHAFCKAAGAAGMQLLEVGGEVLVCKLIGASIKGSAGDWNSI